MPTSIFDEELALFVAKRLDAVPGWRAYPSGIASDSTESSPRISDLRNEPIYHSRLLSINTYGIFQTFEKKGPRNEI